jgi:hypothetical protein
MQKARRRAVRVASPAGSPATDFGDTGTAWVGSSMAHVGPSRTLAEFNASASSSWLRRRDSNPEPAGIPGAVHRHARLDRCARGRLGDPAPRITGMVGAFAVAVTITAASTRRASAKSSDPKLLPWAPFLHTELSCGRVRDILRAWRDVGAGIPDCLVESQHRARRFEELGLRARGFKSAASSSARDYLAVD